MKPTFEYGGSPGCWSIIRYADQQKPRVVADNIKTEREAQKLEKLLNKYGL